MPRKQKTIHYLYKTTCLITGRYYIGMHSTNNLEDGYMGSGKRLRYSLRKHGIDNHKKEILKFFESRELLIEAEKKAITPDMITDNNCMNIMSGGTGGFVSVEAQRKRAICANKIHNEKLKNDAEYRKNWLKKMSEGLKKAHKNGKLVCKLGGLNKGIPVKKEVKQKISNSLKGKGVGKTNSQYGTCWITKDNTDKKIKNEELDLFIQDGWIKGKSTKISQEIINKIKAFYQKHKSYEKTAVNFGIPKSSVVNYVKRG
jgi:hypothetical protein